MLSLRLLITTASVLSSVFGFYSYTYLLRSAIDINSLDLIFRIGSAPLAVGTAISSALLYCLPPIFVKWGKRKQDYCSKFICCITAAIAIALTAVIIIFGVLEDKIYLCGLLSGFVLSSGLIIISAVLMSLSQARGKHWSNVVAALSMSFCLFIFSIIAGESTHLWVFILGHFLGGLLAAIILTKMIGIKLSKFISFNILLAGLNISKKLLKKFFYVLIASLSLTTLPIVDSFITELCAEGSMAIMSYSFRVMIAVGTVISLGSHVIATKLGNDLIKEEGLSGLTLEVNRELSRTIILGLGIWFAYFWVGDYLIYLLLSNSSLKEDSVQSAQICIGIMLLATGPMTCVPYLLRISYLLNDYSTPVMIGILSPLIYLITSLVMVEKFGVVSLCYSHLLVWVTMAFFAYVRLKLIIKKQEINFK